MKYYNAQQAFEHLYVSINDNGLIYRDTKTLFNVGNYILNPEDNLIKTEYRKWNHDYAEYEWQWYLSANPNAEQISKRASIWKNHMDPNGNVQSNYGWQWVRKNQLDRVIDQLINNQNTRQAVLTFYDGKEIENYTYDTPCTLSVHFQIIENKLCMTVMMRSNDLWFGFCNDQYCFSKLQQMVAKEIGIKTGWYYHFASNLHLYNNFLNKNL
jgi:thymidylate synthase